MLKKYWLDKTNESDKIICLGEDMIYKANPKTQEFFEYSKIGEIPQTLELFIATFSNFTLYGLLYQLWQ